MKNILSIIHIPTILLSLTFWGIGCSKETESNSNSTIDANARKANPYDFIGLIHNEFWDSVPVHLSSFPNHTTDEVYEYSVGFWRRQFSKLSYPIVEFPGLVSLKSVVALGSTINSDSVVNFYFNKGSISLFVKIAYSHVFNKVKTANSFTQLKNQLEGYMQGVISNNTMDESDKSKILSVLSVAIHSYRYWESANNNPLNPWYGHNPPQGPIGGIVDAIAFGIGCVVCCEICLIACPTCCIECGAFLGAAASSMVPDAL
jgi:hypothetical protein